MVRTKVYVTQTARMEEHTYIGLCSYVHVHVHVPCILCNNLRL